MDFGVHVGDGLPPVREGAPWEGVKSPQLAQNVGVALVRDAHVALDRRDVPGCDVL